MAQLERLRSRDGFTLVEVIVALMLLSVVALSVGAATGRLASSSALDGQLMTAIDLANERLNRAQGDPSYALLEARHAGTEATLPSFPGLQRVTTVQRVVQTMPDGRQLDYKIIEVTVTGAGLASPVTRRTIVGAP